MSTRANATFKITGWDEKPYKELDAGSKMTRASVTTIFSGDLEAESNIEFLMFYPNDQTASFVGLEYIVGKLGERSGSFVFQHSGVFEDGLAKGAWVVVPGSGTGDLKGLRGEGKGASDNSDDHPFTFDYDFE